MICQSQRLEFCITVLNWDHCPDVTLLAIPKELQETAACHGACRITQNVNIHLDFFKIRFIDYLRAIMAIYANLKN